MNIHDLIPIFRARQSVPYVCIYVNLDTLSYHTTCICICILHPIHPSISISIHQPRSKGLNLQLANHHGPSHAPTMVMAMVHDPLSITSPDNSNKCHGRTLLSNVPSRTPSSRTLRPCHQYHYCYDSRIVQ